MGRVRNIILPIFCAQTDRQTQGRTDRQTDRHADSCKDPNTFVFPGYKYHYFIPVYQCRGKAEKPLKSLMTKCM